MFYKIPKAFKKCFCYRLNHFSAFIHYLKMWIIHHSHLCNNWHNPDISVFNIWKLLLSTLNLSLNLTRFRIIPRLVTVIVDDMASLGEFYCSHIIRALQISSTTRNLVLRFKRWSKERRVSYEILTNVPFRVALIEEFDP